MIVIIIIVLLFLLKNYDQSNPINQPNIMGEAEESVDIEETVIQVKDNDTFYSIEKNLQNYHLYLKVGNKSAVYELMSQDYLTRNELTSENILEHLMKIEDDNYEFTLKELYLNDSNLYPIYYASGELKQNNQKQTYEYIIYTDQANSSWEIEPITKETYNSLLQNKVDNPERQIQKKQYNQLSKVNMNNEDIVKRYFQDYLYNALHDTSAGYQSLDYEYQTKRFGSLQRYQEYLQQRNAQLVSMDLYSIKDLEDFETEEEYNEYIANLQQKGLASYMVTPYTEYIQYIGIDDYGNYYIFKETAPMQYTVILDTYTIDLPEFTQKYANSTEEEKVLLNLQKFFEAINQADYAYAYSKLDETFKANNFKTQQDFENYVKSTFFEQNKLSASNPQRQNDIYLYDLSITDATEKNQNTLTKTFVMQLKEGTDFVMSFGVN